MKNKVSGIELKNSLIKAIHEASPDGILVVDENRNVISHNRRFVEIWNIPSELLSGKEPGTAVGLNDEPILSAVLDQVADSEAFFSRVQELYADPALLDHCEIKLVDGRTLERNSRAIHNGDGQYLGRVWFFHDISNIKQTEKSLQLTQFVSNHAPDSIIWLDEHARIVYTNDAACSLYGYSKNEMHGLTIFDMDIDANIELWSEHWQKLEQQGSLKFESKHRRKDGAFVQVEVSANFVQFEDTKYIVAFVRDIADRKQVEQSLLINQYVSDHATDSIMWIDESSRIIYANEAACREYGYSKTEIVQISVQDFNPKAVSDVWKNQWQRLKQEGYLNFEVMHLRKEGSYFPVEVSANYVDFEGKELNVVFIRNISERKEQQHLQEASRTRFETLFDYSSDGKFILDMQGKFIDVNKTAYEGLGYSKAELMSMKLTELDPPEFAAKVPERMKELMTLGSAVFESAHYRKDGTIMPVEIKARIIELDGEKVVFSVIRDITERKAALNEINNLAFYDPLTNLPNRRLLVDRLQQAIVSSARTGRHGALLFIDLDNFKILNDTLGHDIGDLLLKQVSNRLKLCVREVDTVARLGGDEFMLILEELSPNIIEAGKQTEVIVEKIIVEVSQPCQLDTHEYQTTPSIGVTLFLGNHVKMEELMKQADIAMYQSKKAGRNTMRFFDPEMQHSINTQATLARDLLKAVEAQQFKLFFQVQVDNIGRITGAEALVRWNHPDSGIISSADFIPLAEETGLINIIGKWVLDTACEVLKKWQQDEGTRNLQLAINVSSKQFHKSNFASEVKIAVEECGIDPKLLKLELTESMLLDNIEDTILTMNTLNDIGVMLSLDDFGTGYSSLQYLKRLPLDQLKIDQSFVRDIATDSSDKAIVRTIIGMADSLGLEVIAEGVETVEQRQQLSVMGCKYFQGYLFSKPVSMEDFEALLKKSHAE